MVKLYIENWLYPARDYAWLCEIGLYLALIALVNLFFKRAVGRYQHRVHLQENDWRLHLDYVFFAPVRALLWIFFALFAINLATSRLGHLGAWFDDQAVRNASIIGCAMWMLLRWKTVFQQTLTARRSTGKSVLDPHSIQIMGKIFSFVVLFTGLLIVLRIFGLDMMPLMAFGGIGAAAAGIASKDVIANFFGGLVIHLTRPFTVNELIEMPEKKIVGHIEAIGWYFTMLRDLQKRPTWIPNAAFSTDVMINQSRVTHRRIDEIISIRFEDASRASALIEKIRADLALRKEIDHSQPVYIFVDALAASTIDIHLTAYTHNTPYENFIKIKQEVLLKAYELLRQEGADLAVRTIK
ncbi:MAG: hypothetical protein HW387_1648 [Parachlamydiales bacterium]|nr:hypothetical protein [Parachlamydiales bacterium]